MGKLTLEQYEAAFQAYLYGGGLTDAMRGTRWESDPRIGAYLAAREALADLVHEMHEEAEEAGGMCRDCLHDARQRAMRNNGVSP